MTPSPQQETIVFQTWVPSCHCNNGVIELDGALYCRWCRAPYVEGGMINYQRQHFPKQGKIIISRPSPAPKCDLEIIHCQTANCVKCKEFLDKRDATIVAATLKKFEYIEQLHMDGVSYPDLYNEFIQTYNSLRRPSAPDQEERR